MWLWVCGPIFGPPCIMPRRFEGWLLQQPTRRLHSTADKVQRVLNCAARVILGGSKYDHVTPLIRDDLHWLRVPERITFKLCLLVYKALHGLAPVYIKSMCVPVSSSWGHLIVPRTRLEFGKRTFAFAGPTAWNSLPDIIRSVNPSTLSILFIFSLIPRPFILSYSISYLFLVLICETRPCNVPWHVTAPYKLSFYYYYYYYYQRRGGVEQRHTITALGNPPPTIWKFINGLRRYQKLKDAEIEGLIAGRNAAQRRLAYECVNRRIKNIVLDYQNRDIIDYLRGLAYNIMHWILPLTFR